MFKLSFYVPEHSLETVKNALFSAGAGKLNNYDCCCWQTKGKGQFRALADSNPSVGEKGTVETLDEYLVEMIFAESILNNVISALKASHPYETPAYQFWKINNGAV